MKDVFNNILHYIYLLIAAVFDFFFVFLTVFKLDHTDDSSLSYDSLSVLSSSFISISSSSLYVTEELVEDLSVV